MNKTFVELFFIMQSFRKEKVKALEQQSSAVADTHERN